MSIIPTIYIGGPQPSALYKAGAAHLFVQRLGVNLTDDGPVTMKSILAEVAWRHGVTVEEIKGPRRVAQYARARQEAMYLMVEENRFSLPQIGRFLGNRDHTTVLHGARRHAERLTGAEHPQLSKARARAASRQAAIRAKRDTK